MINIPKGTKDVLPEESYKWQYVEDIARQVCALYNVREIRTPVFEHTELFLRSIGEVTDVVSKEMYTFLDKGNRSITLKAEGTAGVARSFIENGLYNDLPLKVFYISPIFRYERPQAGRLRQHHQFGVEFYGSYMPEFDAEVISLACSFLNRLGINGLTLTLNSIGCSNCRTGYNAALKAFLAAQNENLCTDCRHRALTNPLRTLDCKIESCKKILQNAPKITDFLCDECKTHDMRLKEILKQNNIDFVCNENLVRGLDYYTKTVFELIQTDTGLTVFGGGRYDNLIEQLDGKPTPCVGFGMGLERLIGILQSQNLLPHIPRPLVFVACQNDSLRDICIQTVNKLRQNGLSAETDLSGKSLKAQLKQADRQGFIYTVVIGGDEINTKKLKLKRMSDGALIDSSFDTLIEDIKQKGKI